MIFTYALTVFGLIVGFLYLSQRKTKRKLPPGPRSIPLFGNLLQIGFQPHLRFTEWAKKYGPIFRIKLAMEEAIVITDHKLLKELFNDNISTGRLTDNPVAIEFTKGPYGVINSEDATWEEQRKFTIQTLRKAGFAKASMEGLISDEVQSMMNYFRKTEGTPITGTRIFHAPVINSLWRLVTSERCDWEENRPPILDAADEFFKAAMVVTSNGVYFAPFLRYIAPGLLGWNRYVKSIDAMMELFNKSIRAHKETFDSENLRDFIDSHLLEAGNEKNPQSSFYEHAGYANLRAGLFDLFLAGSETSSNLLSWGLLYLTQNQNVQAKLQAEIDLVVGSRSPSLADKKIMPYTEAVISEILRIVTVLPVGSPHRMLEDKCFHGYHLPKGAAVFGNLYGIHHDEVIWTDPDHFKPERFLNEDGTKIIHNEALIPFGDGKRKCIGDTMGKDTIFLFVTNIFQQFNVLPAESEKPDFEPELGIVMAPKPFKIMLSSRH